MENEEVKKEEFDDNIEEKEYAYEKIPYLTEVWDFE